MKKFLIAGALLLSGTSSFAQDTWTVTSSSVEFFIRNAGVEVDGSMKGFEGEISFSPDQLSASSIIASVNPATVNTGIDTRDEHLRNDEYFDVETYPRITMKSVSFAPSGSSYKGTFDLTIKGITKRVSFPFTFSESGTSATFKGELEIDRLEYEVGESSWILSDEVRIEITVVGRKS